MDVTVVLDSSAILNDFGFSFKPRHTYFTTPQIMQEFRDLRSRMLVDNAVNRSLLKLQEASEESKQLVTKKSQEKGMNLSEADISVIALALDLKPLFANLEVQTDDHSIQNMLLHFKLPFKAVIRGTVKQEITIEKRCAVCKKRFPPTYEEPDCDVCGTELGD